MPHETQDYPEEEPHEASDEIEPQIAERMELAKRDFGDLYDHAIAEGKDPREDFLDEAKKRRAVEIFGEERVDAFQEAMRTLTWTSRDEFVESMLAIAEPLLRARETDPDVLARVEARRKQEEEFDAGGVQAKLRRSEDEVTLHDGTHIKPGDVVVELSVAAKETPLGYRALRESLQAIAKYVEEHPDVVAVTGVSWMMKRRLVEKLGFEVLNDVPIDLEEKHKIAKNAQDARNDKNYHRKVTPDDVSFGAQSREEFLQRYREGGNS